MKRGKDQEPPFSPVKVDDLRNENLGRLLIESFRVFRANTLKHYRENGIMDLTPVQAAMMRRVHANGSRFSELAGRMGVSRQAIAQIVASTERLGYVKTEDDSTDARAKIVICTKKGRKFLRSLKGILTQSNRDVEAIIGKQRLKHLEETLILIATHGRL